jgi:hypothetical protein
MPRRESSPEPLGPASVPKTRDLVYVRSAPGTKHTSTLTRDAKGILVKIAPS